MPATLPVPSKGALRALRKLALGTSCTVAFSAGILTEDRRRRIHAARQVHDNAKKLKSSRKYHSAGAAVAETFDEQVLGYRDDRTWALQDPLRRSKAQKRAQLSDWHPSESTTAEEITIDGGDDISRSKESFNGVQSGEEKVPRPWRPTPPESIKVRRYTLYNPATPLTRWRPSGVAWKPLYSDQSAPPPEVTKTQIHNRQLKLASDIRKILGNGEDPANVDAASSRFLDTFEEGLTLGESGLNDILIEAAVGLNKACRAHGKFERSEKIFDTILSCGPVSQDVFFSFNPAGLIRDVLKGPQDASTGHKVVDEGRIKKACALFSTTFTDQPKIDAPAVKGWAELGLKLCAEAYHLQMFKITEDLYWHLAKYSRDVSIRAVKFLIRAVYHQNKHNLVVQYFRRFYIQTSPDQLDFYETGKLVIESVVDVPTPNYEVAEEVLFMILEMAEDKGLKSSTTCALKVLGSRWRAHRDLFEIKTLFARLEPSLRYMGHPQAVYGAVIQFCVEADDEASALAYYDRMRETYKPAPGDVRIYGHFAYSKAMRKDWEGVRNDFRHMKDSNPRSDEYCAAFTPILHLFSKSESVRETEQLLREFVEQFGIKLTPYMSNIMIDKYLQAKEIDSVSRWLEYMYSIHAPIATNLFNTILVNCHRKWKFSFDEVWQLYSSVKGKGKLTGHFINEGTESTLRSIAISTLGQNVEPATRSLKLWARRTSDPVRQTDIREDMAIALAKGDAISALKLYKGALAHQIPLDASVVSIAVQASLRIHPEDINATAALLHDLVRKGQDISGALSSIFIHQISAIYCNDEEGCRHVQEVARNTLSALEERGILIPTRAVTHVMSILRARNQNRQAIDFWESMSRRKGRAKFSLDLATITVLLEAYIGLQDPVGIKWVMQMLAAHDLSPDKRFKRVLTNARARAEKQRHRGDILEEIIHALEDVKEMRSVAIQEKENVKFKTIRIMDRAIKVQKARGGAHDADMESGLLSPNGFGASSDNRAGHRREWVSCDLDM